jgi:hypothetical protein
VHETVRKLKILIKLNIFEQINLYFVQHSRLNAWAVASDHDVVREMKLEPKPDFRSSRYGQFKFILHALGCRTDPDIVTSGNNVELNPAFSLIRERRTNTTPLPIVVFRNAKLNPALSPGVTLRNVGSSPLSDDLSVRVVNRPVSTKETFTNDMA